MDLNRQAPLPIEDYALIGDCRGAALVAKDGSIDWLCWPRFDSSACLAALLGTPEHGRYRIRPASEATATRRYVGETMILETRFRSGEGEVLLTDFMVPAAPHPTLVRIVRGIAGTVPMRMDLALRFDYGRVLPWVTARRGGNGIVAVAGPDMVILRTEAPLHGAEMTTVSDFVIAEGHHVGFVLTHCPSHLPVPLSYDPSDALDRAQTFWESWSEGCHYDGPWAPAVRRSLLTLKCLTHEVTGGIVAAPTTSLPEEFGGERNWDYRFCWLRDATLTLFAFMAAGYFEEAAAWARWLQRTAAGSPGQVQIMYGVAGERRLEEWVVDTLPGYRGATPVRIGNEAAKQLQLDVFGEVCGALSAARRGGLLRDGLAWPLQRELLAHLADLWREPDSGLWESRGPKRHYTFSKVMCWMAFNRSAEDAERFGLDAPLDQWRAIRDEIHHTVCRDGFNQELNSFTQYFGGDTLDASLLLIPTVGFLPGTDPRVAGTVAAIERTLLEDGFVRRYRTETGEDGVKGSEGAFLACTFWLAGARHLQGRDDEARELMDRLVALSNDVGLLAEEYDVAGRRFAGNFPQAFSHVALVTTALAIAGQRASEH